MLFLMNFVFLRVIYMIGYLKENKVVFFNVIFLFKGSMWLSCLLYGCIYV